MAFPLLSDNTARMPRRAAAHWKECASTALLTASKDLSSPVSLYLQYTHYNQVLGRHACSRVTYVAHCASCIGVERWRCWRNRVQPAPEPFILHERPLEVTSRRAGSDMVAFLARVAASPWIAGGSPTTLETLISKLIQAVFQANANKWVRASWEIVCPCTDGDS